MKLLCLPYAGGFSVMYEDWKRKYNKDIEIINIEYAGRGKKTNQPLYNSLEEAVFEIYDEVKEAVKNDEFAIFGYSLGGKIAYELACLIKQKMNKSPVHLFIGACNPPHVKGEVQYHRLDEMGLINKLINMGGTPKEILTNKEARDYFMPIISSDLRLADLYMVNNRVKLDCGITVFYGAEDQEINLTLIEEWKQYVNGSAMFEEYSSGHFFIKEYSNQILDIIKNTLFSYRLSKA